MVSHTKTPRLDISEDVQDNPSHPKDKLLKVQDISQKSPLPIHIKYLMTLKGDQDFISIHEWAARLAHAVIVETGYFPVIDGTLEESAKEALEMPDEIRIPRFVRKLSPDQMFSDRGVYILKYRAILGELVETDAESVNASLQSNPLISIESTLPKDIGNALDEKISGVTKAKSKFQNPQEWIYRFSADINVTMVIMEDGLLLTATYSPGEGSRCIFHQITINIEEFLTQRVRMVPMKLRADQWNKKFDLNSTRFAGFLKNKFAIYFMDQINGMVFERRGIICLPDLVLLKILKMSSVRTVLHMARTCLSLYDAATDNGLWQHLVKRDFPNENFLPGPSTNISPLNGTENSKEDFYEFYKEKYLAKHRRTHRTSAFSRFQPDLRTRRFQSSRFNFLRF